MKKFLLTAVLVLIGVVAFAQERIAVFPFEDMDNVFTRNESTMFYREFSNEFANRSSGRFAVVPRQEIEKLINTEADFQLREFSARAKTAEMGRVLNGSQILSGLIARVGNNIRITVSLYTYPELQQLPGGATLSVSNKNELFSKIPELVRSMQNEIAGGRTEQPVPEGLEFYIVGGRTVTITGYKGNANILEIPERIQGLPVTRIRNNSITASDRWGGSDTLTNVIIPASVTTIDERGFMWLTNIIVDNRNPVYASIDGVLFDKNIKTLIQYPQGRKVNSYIIPLSVTSIGGSAFTHAYNLKIINIPPSVTSIGIHAFSVSGLTSITIPYSVTFIGDWAFSFISDLSSINVDNQNPVYVSIDGILFDKNIRNVIVYPAKRNARTYSIPSSVTSIGGAAFSDCLSLTSISIPSSVTSIGEYAFEDCNNLTSVSIPSSVTSIRGRAFFGCSSLTSVTIPSSVTSIEYEAFCNCSSLTSITLSRRTQVGERAFPASARITYRD